MCIFTKNKSINALQHLKHAREIMMINKKLAFKLTILPLILGSASHTAMAYGNDEVKKDDVEKIAVIGSRSLKQRSVADSPVPVDLISSEDLNAIGGTADMTDNLKALIPSYTASPATGDGSAFVRSTSCIFEYSPRWPSNSCRQK